MRISSGLCVKRRVPTLDEERIALRRENGFPLPVLFHLEEQEVWLKYRTPLARTAGKRAQAQN
jgi:hypothetical protein